MIPGDRIRLRPVEREDLPRFVVWFADPAVRANLALYKPMSLAQEERWFDANLASSDTQAWAIDARSEAEEEAWAHIGSCGYHEINWRNRSGEIGIVIGDRSYWGRGFGVDATRTLVRWGFDTLGLNRIYLRVYADNARAIRCYEKVGFSAEGRLRQDNFHDGAYRDTLIMALLLSEWRR